MRPVRVVLPLVLASSVLAPVVADARYEPPNPKDTAAAQRIAAAEALPHARAVRAFNSMGGGGRGSRLSGLLPDGVASVTLEFPKRVGRERNYEPKVFPSAFTRTVRVQENVVSLRVPRGAEDAFPARMVWRAADGSVVRVVKQP